MLIERALAIRFDEHVGQGKTEPLRVTIERPCGDEQDVILKPSHNPNLAIGGMMNEMLGALIASDLGIPVPQPFFVELGDDFIESVKNAGLKVRLSQACPLAFASADAGSDWRRWSPQIDHLHADNRDLALNIFAFDGFVGNPDRSSQNPNLLIHVSDPRLLAIDHDSAFDYALPFLPVSPWNNGYLNPLQGGAAEHVLYRPLKSSPALNFGGVQMAWDGLSTARFAEYQAALPAEWANARPALTAALAHFENVRVRINECMDELRRVLQ